MKKYHGKIVDTVLDYISSFHQSNLHQAIFIKMLIVVLCGHRTIKFFFSLSIFPKFSLLTFFNLAKNMFWNTYQNERNFIRNRTFYIWANYSLSIKCRKRAPPTIQSLKNSQDKTMKYMWRVLKPLNPSVASKRKTVETLFLPLLPAVKKTCFSTMDSEGAQLFWHFLSTKANERKKPLTSL